MTSVTELDELLSGRLYHELTSAVLAQLTVTELQGERIKVFRKYIESCVSLLNPLRVLDLVRELLRRGDDDGAVVLGILESVLASCSGETRFQRDCLRVECLLRMSESQKVRDILAELEDAVASETSWKSVSEYSRVSAMFYKQVGNLSQVYLHGVGYLTVTPCEFMRHSSIIVDAAMAGLLAETVFDFGSLLGEEAKIRGIDDHLLALLKTFDAGNIAQFNHHIAAHFTHLFTPAQVAILNTKIQLMALLHLAALSQQVRHSKVAFAEISDAVFAGASGSASQEQTLVLRAFGGGLMRGRIDEVAQCVHVDWVRPRILDKPRAGEMKRRFEDWHGRIAQAYIPEQSR